VQSRARLEREAEERRRGEGECRPDDLLLPREVAREEQRGVERKREPGGGGRLGPPPEQRARGRVSAEREEGEDQSGERAVGLRRIRAAQLRRRQQPERDGDGPVL
jgi:hypothetical protein